jgi:hypothetical protein
MCGVLLDNKNVSVVDNIFVLNKICKGMDNLEGPDVKKALFVLHIFSPFDRYTAII